MSHDYASILHALNVTSLADRCVKANLNLTKEFNLRLKIKIHICESQKIL